MHRCPAPVDIRFLYICRLHPNNSGALVNLGKLLKKRRQWEEAEYHLLRAVEDELGNLIQFSHTLNERRREKIGLQGLRPPGYDTNQSVLQKEAGTKFSHLGRRGVVLSVYRKNAADQLCSFGTVYLRLCFRICKKPVFSRGGSDKNTCQIAYSGVLFTSCA